MLAIPLFVPQDKPVCIVGVFVAATISRIAGFAAQILMRLGGALRSFRGRRAIEATVN
jgi:hypothetical protein